jgi:hypothetical protein
MRQLAGFAIALVLSSSTAAWAQLPRGLPLPLTMEVAKPAPNATFGDAQVIELGYKMDTYKFILKDAYVDDQAGNIIWNDVWRQVQLSRPNMLVQGEMSGEIGKIAPGQTVTLRGIYAPITRTFEINAVDQGTGISEPPKHY